MVHEDDDTDKIEARATRSHWNAT